MYVLDSDVAVEFLRGREEVVRSVLSLESVCTTVITVAELSYGVHKSQNPERHRKKLSDFVRGIRIFTINLPVCDKFGELKAHLAKIGRPAEDFDIFIASICIVNGCHLITRNRKHYQDVPGLRIYDL